MEVQLSFYDPKHLDWLMGEQPEPYSVPSIDLEAQLQARRKLRKLLACIPLRWAVPLELVGIQGKRQREVAAYLGVAQPVVSIRKRVAMRAVAHAARRGMLTHAAYLQLLQREFPAHPRRALLITALDNYHREWVIPRKSVIPQPTLWTLCRTHGTPLRGLPPTHPILRDIDSIIAWKREG